MTRQSFKETVLWGFILWLIGYLLGIILFAFVSQSLLGWMILPIGTTFTLWVLFKKIHSKTFLYYLGLGLIWLGIAIIFDYFFLVKLFNPVDGYYKLDVYVYYTLILTLPLLVGWKKSHIKF